MTFRDYQGRSRYSLQQLPPISLQVTNPVSEDWSGSASVQFPHGGKGLLDMTVSSSNATLIKPAYGGFTLLGSSSSFPSNTSTLTIRVPLSAGFQPLGMYLAPILTCGWSHQILMLVIDLLCPLSISIPSFAGHTFLLNLETDTRPITLPSSYFIITTSTIEIFTQKQIHHRSS